MRYLHTMVRVRDLDESLRFYCEGLGLRVLVRVRVIIRWRNSPLGSWNSVCRALDSGG